MEVLFLSTVPGAGNRGEIKDVTEGFARNYLFPKALATRATEQARRQYATMLKQRQVHAEQSQAAEQAFIGGLQGAAVVLRAVANEHGRLFQGIDRRTIVHAVSQQLHYALQLDQILLEKPIKEIGAYSIPIRVGTRQANLSVVIQQ